MQNTKPRPQKKTTQNQKLYTSLSIGIDVGGTNTDAVLLCEDQIVQQAKVLTSHNVTDGIVEAIRKLLEFLPNEEYAKIHSIMIGTTHLINALLQRKNLNPVLALRLGKPATTAAEPGLGWEESWQKLLISDSTFIVHGGYEYNGDVLSLLQEKEILACARKATELGIHSVAIIGVFSHVNPAQEKAVKELLKSSYPDFQFSLSHELGSLGLLTRENATIINASLIKVYQSLHASMQKAVKVLGLNVQLYLSNSAGSIQPITLHNQDTYSNPILTLNSGPTNSIRGAGVISGIKDAIVVDIGGTSSDAGILSQGFPVMENAPSEVVDDSGIRCYFPKARTISIALGGGSKINIRFQSNPNEEEISIGSESVANDLLNQALCCGGDQLTVTDIAVAKGRLNLGLVNNKRLRKEFIGKLANRYKLYLEDKQSNNKGAINIHCLKKH